MTEFNHTKKPVVPLFPLGRIMASANALKALNIEDICSGLARHVRGDWGDVSEVTARCNEDYKIRTEVYLGSSYQSASGVRFRVTTDIALGKTRVLLPSDDSWHELWPPGLFHRENDQLNAITMTLDRKDIEFVERVFYKDGEVITDSIPTPEEIEECLKCLSAVESRIIDSESIDDADRKDAMKAIGNFRKFFSEKKHSD